MQKMMNILALILFPVLLTADPGASQDSLKTKPVPPALKKLVEQILKQPQERNEIDIEIDGLLVDDTKTKAGKDFYDLFYGSWIPPEGAKNFSITVSEKPFRLTSTLVVITINENVVYQAILQPRLDIIEFISQEAIMYAQNYLVNYEEIMKELNGDDMSGTGIF